MGKDSVTIYVAAHKEEQLDLPDGYRICQVNAERNGKWSGNIIHDNDGDNISLKNDSFCELTALYELWKNSNSDIKGLVHYRRFFADDTSISFLNYLNTTIPKRYLYNRILGKKSIVQYLKNYDVIVEYPRAPYPVNAYEDLLRFVFPENIRALSDVISTSFPEYEKSYWSVLASTNISYLNMFIARNEIFSAYCEWLFQVLFKLKDRIDIENYDAQHKRIFGYLGEVLLNVWLLRNNLKVKYAYRVSTSDKTGFHAYFRSRRYSKIVKALYFKTIKRKSNTYEQKRYQLMKMACQEPYTYTLDNVYDGLNCLDDVLSYYSSLGIGTVSKELVRFNGEEWQYACLKTEANSYQYLQSNNRCIVTVFLDDLEDAVAFAGQIESKYENSYTVNIRIITNNSKVLQLCDIKPEIYVYKMH